MKRLSLKVFGIIISFSMVMLLSTAFVVYASVGGEAIKGWNALSDDDGSSLPEVNVSALHGPGLKIDLTLPGFSLGTVTHSGKKFDQILFENQSSLGQKSVGAPNVAILRYTIGILDNSDLKLTVDNVDYVEFSNINLEPLQKDLFETEQTEKNYDYDKNIYTTNKLFPDSWAQALNSDTGRFHGVALGSVEIFPVRYNPVSKKAQIARSLSISVEFIEKTPNTTPASISPHLENVYKGMLVNYDLMKYPVKKSSFGNTGTDYLILISPGFINSPSLKQFTDYYQGLGMNVEIKNVADIGKTAQQIKEYISKVYGRGNEPELDYVLLVGDVDTIPFKTLKRGKSDIWYAWLDGRDHVGDVGLGRFPAKNESELQMMVDKSLAYSKNLIQEPWKSRSLLVSHKQGYPERYTEVHREIFDRYQGQVEMVKLEGGDNSSSWMNQDIASQINKGSLVVTYRGQGQCTNWSDWNSTKESFETMDVDRLTNGQKTPIVFSITCNTADLDSKGKTLAEAFMVQKQGAVAYMGALDKTVTRVNNDFNTVLYAGIYESKIETIGDLYNYSNAILFQKNKEHKNLYPYLWLGDPALRFEPVPVPVNKVNLTIDIKGSGTVEPKGGLFEKGTKLTLTAKPGKDAKFERWEGDASGTLSSVNITMDNDKKVVAVFSDTNPKPPTGEVASDDLEEYGWSGGKGLWVGGWVKTGDVRKKQKKPFSGAKYARLRNNGKLERVVDLSKTVNPILSFAARFRDFEAKDKAVVKVSSDGKTYTEVQSFTIEQSNNLYKVYEISLAQFKKSANFHIVFESQMDQVQDFWYLDNFVISEK